VSSFALHVGQSVQVLLHVGVSSHVVVPSNVRPQLGLAWQVGQILQVSVHVSDTLSHVFEPLHVKPLLHVGWEHSGQMSGWHV
jgi:hypothetical protein